MGESINWPIHLYLCFVQCFCYVRQGSNKSAWIRIMACPDSPAQSVIGRLIGWPGAASRTNSPRATTSSPLTSSDCTPSAGWLGFS